MIRIRPFATNDADSAWDLRLFALKTDPDAFGQTWEEASRLTPEEFHHVQATFWTGVDNMVFLAETNDGTLVGMTGLARNHRAKQRHSADIWGVFVHPGWRGQGIASRLLDAAIDHARSIEGLLQIQLNVMTVNAHAGHIYARKGFVRFGRLPRADRFGDTNLDMDSMVLMLDDYDFEPLFAQD